MVWRIAHCGMLNRQLGVRLAGTRNERLVPSVDMTFSIIPEPKLIVFGVTYSMVQKVPEQLFLAKPLPKIVTCVPILPDEGEIAVMDGSC
jgi:hypothetical protein